MDKNLLQKAKVPMIALIQKKNIVENKTKQAFALLLLLGLLMPLASQAFVGSGTETDPYLIRNVNDLYDLVRTIRVYNIDYEGNYFLVTNDICCDWDEYKVGGTFKGNLDGGGHTISHFTVSGIAETGLFSKVEDASISNLILNECIINASQSTGGGIVGKASNSVIENCEFHGAVTSNSNKGGIVGWLVSGSVINCRNYGEVSGKRAVGGIVGNLEDGNVNNCRNYGEVRCSGSRAGGIVGEGTDSGIVENCVNSGEVWGGLNDYIGGIIGYNGSYAIVRNNLSTGVVIGSGIAGGYKWVGRLSNNYYTQAENYGANGSDHAGRAMRGYTITGESPIEVSLPEGATVGLAYKGVVYAGVNQEVPVSFEISNIAFVPQCLTLSAGSLTDNGDGTYTITMPEEDITVNGNVVEHESLYFQLDCDGSTTATVIQHASYATTLVGEFAVPYGFTYGETYYEVTAIGDHAFEGCTGITELYLNENMAAIGSEAFKNCTGLTKITSMPLVPPTAAANAFCGVPTDIPVEVAFCSQYDYSVATGWSGFNNFQGTGPCEHTFIGMEDNLWSNPNNWMGGLPDGISRVGINGYCEIDDDVEVGSITIGNFYLEDEGDIIMDRLTVKAGKTLTANNFIYTSGEARHFVINDGAQVVHPNASAKATVQKAVSAYSTQSGVNNGWHLIALPITGSIDVDSVDNMIEGEYDLYGYDEPTTYWMNSKHSGDGFTSSITLRSTS